MAGFGESKRAWKERALRSRWGKQLLIITQCPHYDKSGKLVFQKKAVRFGYSPYRERICGKLMRNKARIQEILRRYCHNPNITFREWGSMITQGTMGDIAGASKRMWELEKRTEYMGDVLEREKEMW